MHRSELLILILFLCSSVFSQETETVRYEVPRWGKEQDFHFESFQERGGMLVYSTEQTDGDKNRLWHFVQLDSSLYEQQRDTVPLPPKMRFFDSKSSSQWAVFVFLEEKASRSDSIPLRVVTYNRVERSFATITDMMPEHSSLLSIALIDGSLMLAVNPKTGSGFLSQYDLSSQQRRMITPGISNDYLLFQLDAVKEGKAFVVAAREFVEKRYQATSFLVYSREGRLLHRHRFDNVEGVVLGRTCFAFDASQQLMVYGTLERETGRKANVQGMIGNFDRTSIGVVWIKFATGGLESKTYLFKDLPDIDKALTSSDRLRVKEELLKMRQGKKKEKGEIAFQFLTPRLTSFGDLHVFSAEAFQPVFHQETRMEYGFYTTYPAYYTVFDGYDFFSEILLAFDDEGKLQWQTSVRFENELSTQLVSRSMESIAHEDLVVASPGHHRLRYEVFDKDGTQLLDQQSLPLDFLNGADTYEDEYDAGLFHWYGDCFLVYGCQMIRNGIQRNPLRTVFYVQKVQYE